MQGQGFRVPRLPWGALRAVLRDERRKADREHADPLFAARVWRAGLVGYAGLVLPFRQCLDPRA